MKLLIFRTDIKTKKKVKSLKPILKNQSTITEWTVDTEDIDNVLRIEAKETLTEKEVIHLLKKNGYYCEPLLD
ncbi:hypothetical protein OOZ15_16820 [Galbibacter sp. EGI 63066]|uniref:hypothetical protein n=1 Tax=Galbibacter sp. EGI 63066 TaxID=2993559 RepID=UPI00224968EA|nr:hypothetical protein [Galbibacter sp. EGI 63066]MCX2681617.1 hypothetical protein [Galbibacter sp. EGI 63066]